MSEEYLQRRDRLQEAKLEWEESEWLLNFLRTQGSEPKPKSDEEVLIWSQNLAKT